MKVAVKSLRMKNVCAYLRNINQAYLGVDNKVFELNYLPIINQFEINQTAGIKFRYFDVIKNRNSDSYTIQTNVNNDIEVYDPNNSKFSNLYKSVIRENKYTVEKGDLILGPSFIVLNLTKEPITIYDHLNNVAVFHPVEQNKFLKAAEGKIIIFAIHHITTPINYTKATGIEGNYLKDYLDTYKFNPTQMDKMPGDKFHQSLKLKYFAAQAWDSFVERGEDLNVPDIKVISIGSFTPNIFVDEATEEEVSVFFKDIDLYVTKSKNFVPVINPACERNSELNQLKENIIPGTPCIFIVDPDNEVKPRYYALHNKVYMVPKIKSNYREKGLWIAKFDKNFNLVDEYHVPIDKIKDLDFLFEHQDEAREFCSFKEKRERELKELELELKRMEQEIKMKRLETEYEIKSRLKKLEEEHLEFKHKLERETLKFKAEMEEKKHKQDYTIETLKTFAAIAGVFASGFVILNKVSKNQKEFF